MANIGLFGQSEILEALNVNVLTVNDEFINSGPIVVVPGNPTDNSIQLTTDPTTGVDLTTSPNQVSLVVGGVNTIYANPSGAFVNGDPSNSFNIADKAYVDYSGFISALGNAATTPIATPGTYVKAVFSPGTTAVFTNGYSMPVSNRLQYIGTGVPATTVTKVTSIQANCVLYNNSGVACSLGIALAINGVVNTNTIMNQVLVPTGTTSFANLTTGMINAFSSAQYVELWVTNYTNNVAPTVVNLNLYCK